MRRETDGANVVPSGISVLVVEDNPADVDLIRDALEESLPAPVIQVARDGAEAIELVRGRGPHAGARLPDLVLLDLNLPRLSGFEVLEAMKSDARLWRIPVVVLTTSDDEADVGRSYDGRANAFVTKPFDYDDLASAVRAIRDYWTHVATLPPRCLGRTMTGAASAAEEEEPHVHDER